MCPGLIQLDDENAVFVLLTHQIEKRLETITVEVRELVEEMCSRGWFDDAVEVSCLELPLHFALGLDALSGDLAPTYGLESKPRFILTEEADRSLEFQYDNGIPNQEREIFSKFFYMPPPARRCSGHSPDGRLWARL